MTRNRRLWIGISVGVVVALLSVATANLALAQGPDAGAPPVHCPGFVDEDGDGVCDNFVDQDGDGVCDSRGGVWRTGRGRSFAGLDGDAIGNSFIDENGDGVCDNYVDEDGNGVCDGLSPAPRAGRGQGGRFGNRGYGKQSGSWQ